MTSLSYQELRPPAPLAPWIAAIWQIRGSASAVRTQVHRVLPDACIDFLFDFGPSSGDAGTAVEPAGVLVGPMTRALLVQLPASVDLFGIRFRPGVMRCLADYDAHELQDRVVPLTDMGISFGLSADQWCKPSSLRARSAVVLPLIARHLTARPAPDATVQLAMEQWLRAFCNERTCLSVAAVARRAGVSERCLERRFAACVGYSPAYFRRLARFRTALHLSDVGRRAWAETAMRCGYADQAHLSRDFQQFALTTATGWAAEQHAVGIVQDGQVQAM